MRIKLDENLPASLVPDLTALGHDVDTALDEGLQGERDEHVWLETQAAQRFLITQDLDFSDVRRFAPGSHCGILLVRFASPGRARLHQGVLALVADAGFVTWEKCLVVASEHKLRIRRPAE